MAKAILNLQDSFLNQMRKDGTGVKIVLLDGSVIVGRVKGFDNFTVVLASEGKQHLIYKHAISQIVSADEFRPSPLANSGRKKNAFNPIDLSHLRLNEENK